MRIYFLFAYDTIRLLSSKHLKDLEASVDKELAYIKKWVVTNKLKTILQKRTSHFYSEIAKTQVIKLLCGNKT